MISMMEEDDDDDDMSHRWIVCMYVRRSWEEGLPARETNIKSREEIPGDVKVIVDPINEAQSQSRMSLKTRALWGPL